MGRRTIDLSTRNVPRPASPIPSFSQRYHTASSSAGTVSADIFVPKCACTVLSIEFQVGQSCTVQLLENGEPASLSQLVQAGAVSVFPGRLLANNTKLTITASVSTSISWHVVWVKDFESELIYSTAPAVLVPGIVTASDAPTGGESGIVSRDIFRKKQTLLTSTPLAANGVFTSAWFDTELTGTTAVAAVSVSNVAGAATNGLQIFESEDQVNSIAVSALGAQLTLRNFAYIRARYFRVVYTNGVTIQASFSLYITETSVPFAGDSSTSQVAQLIIPVVNTGALVVLGDAFSNQSGASWGTAAVPGGGQSRVATYLFNGTSWDRPRTPAIFKQVSTAAIGSTALWTPVAGKKFRLMRYRIQVTASAVAAVAGDLTISLLDAAAGLAQICIVSIPNAGLTAGVDYESGWIDLGNGILSALANNVLNLNLSFALTGGLVNVSVCGTEE